MSFVSAAYRTALQASSSAMSPIDEGEAKDFNDYAERLAAKGMGSPTAVLLRFEKLSYLTAEAVLMSGAESSEECVD